MTQQLLLNKLLNRDFFDSVTVTKDLFTSDDYAKVFTLIADTHRRVDHDLSTAELLALWEAQNPTATKSKKAAVAEALEEIAAEPEITDDVGRALVFDLGKQAQVQKVCSYAADLMNNIGDVDTLKRMVADISNTPEETFIPLCEADITTIYETEAEQGGFHFSPSVLRERIPMGMTRGQFGVIFASSNTGKTAMTLTMSVGPEGYVKQGYKVLNFGNEEVVTTTRKRSYCCAFGVDQDEIRRRSIQYTESYLKNVAPHFLLQEASQFTIQDIERYIEHHQPDVVFVDQLDKVVMPGYFPSTQERLGALYTEAREVAKRQQVVLWGICQASDMGKEQTVLTPDMMANSRVSKQAECDMIIGIGRNGLSKSNEDAPVREDFTRYLTVGKNKVNGWHGTVTCKLEQAVNRYVD